MLLWGPGLLKTEGDTGTFLGQKLKFKSPDSKGASGTSPERGEIGGDEKLELLEPIWLFASPLPRLPLAEPPRSGEVPRAVPEVGGSGNRSWKQ